MFGGSLQQELAPFLDQAAAASSPPSPTPPPADPSPEPEPELTPGIYQVYQSQTRSHDSTENLENIQIRDELRLSSEAPSLEWEEDFPDTEQAVRDTEQAVRNLNEGNMTVPSDSFEKEAEVEEKTRVADEESKDISESNGK